ncbi:MAG: cytochrome-c peroxidase, partial [Planctomycetes bacterium]|nr:cytochrome-c peroxidase [Planctomycetota bacterium]
MRPLFSLLTLAVSATAQYQLPPVPVPSQNPMTPAKVVLGKILFWDEQLSSDDSIACGTCHVPE